MENKISLKGTHLLCLLIMLYVVIMMISIAMVYKLVEIGPLTMASSSIVLPIWYVLGDIIAEVYGYKTSRVVIWSALLCEAIFIFSIVAMIHLPSPSFWHYQADFNVVFGKLPRVFLGSVTGIALGSFMNVYILTKWKALIHGKYFWLRSVGSCAIGEGIFTVVTIMFDYIGVFDMSKILQMILISYSIKLSASIFLAGPANFIVNLAKKHTGVDMYDYSTNFNPFKL